MKNRTKQILAAVMAAATVVTSAAPAFAEAPEVTTDETAYITLDSYGERTDLSIVKSVRLNGNTSFEDYGRYSKVVNMSTLDQPTLTEEGVKWELSKTGNGRFYYEVHTEEDFLSVPWDIDVSYSLNGVPIKAEELAGKSGLIAVDVDVTPNPLADEYYKKNFILVCGALSDSGKNYSFKADRAQLQTLGSYQIAMFMAFPAQKEHFHIEMGSDDFTFPGLIFASMPLTISQAEDIAEIGKDKEDIKAAADSMDSMLRDVLDIMNSITVGTTETAQGLRELESAWEVVEQEHDSISDQVDKTRYALRRLKSELYDLSNIVEDNSILDNMDDIEDQVGGMLNSLETLGTLLKEVGKITHRMTQCLRILSDPTSTPVQKAQAMAELQELLKQLEGLLGQIKSVDGADFTDRTESLHTMLQELDGALGSSDSMDAQMVQAMIDSLDGISAQVKQELTDSMDGLEDAAAYTSGSQFGDLSGEANVMARQLSRVLDETASTVGKLEGLMGKLDGVLSDSYDNLNRGIHATLNGTANMLERMTVALHKTQNIKANQAVIYDLFNKNWDKLNDDLGILDIDPTAQKLSFTSSRNAEPNSLQIVMRTQSITKPDDPVVEVEENVDDRTFMERLGDVFTTIYDAVAGLFR